MVINILIDLDDTLVLTKSTEETNIIAYDTLSTPYGISHIRPHMDIFIAYLMSLNPKDVHIYVYSAGSKEYVHEVTAAIFPMGLLKGVFTQDDCNLTPYGTTKILPSYIKPENSIAIDDRTDVYISPDLTIIAISPFYTINTEHDKTTKQILTRAGFVYDCDILIFHDRIFTSRSLADVFAEAIIGNVHIAVKNLVPFFDNRPTTYIPIFECQIADIDSTTLHLLTPMLIRHLRAPIYTVNIISHLECITNKTLEVVLERGTEELLVALASMPQHNHAEMALRSAAISRGVLSRVIKILSHEICI